MHAWTHSLWQFKLGKLLLYKDLLEQKNDLNQRLQRNADKLTSEEKDSVRLEQRFCEMQHECFLL